jgi:transposase
MGRHQDNIVYLTQEERNFLSEYIKKGDWKPREVIRAKILLLSDLNGEALLDREVAEKLSISLSAVRYRRKRFAETGSIEDSLFDNLRTGRPTIVDGATEAHMTAIACSEAPEGHAKWTLRLIKDRLITLEVIDSISHSTVGRALKKKKSNRG